LAGTATSEVSTNSLRTKVTPQSLPSRCLVSSGLKPTLTARRMPASISFLISSMRSEVPN
jgi:hypothetical protein